MIVNLWMMANAKCYECHPCIQIMVYIPFSLVIDKVYWMLATVPQLVLMVPLQNVDCWRIIAVKMLVLSSVLVGQ